MALLTVPPIETCWQADLDLSYLRVGNTGPAVVLVHGWGAFKELWWRTLLMLAPHYCAFAPDLPAHGASPAATPTTTMRDLAHLVEDFCAAHTLDSITLVGHSMGGNVALELALLRPALVQRLVLVDPAITTDLMPAYVHFHKDAAKGWAALRIRLALSAVFGTLGAYVPHCHGGGWIRPWLRRSFYMRNHDPTGMYYLLQELLANPLNQRASQIQVPTLVMTGQFDSLVPVELSRHLAESIPSARFAIIPGAIHNPMDERPDAFDQVLLAFLGAA